MAKASAVIMVRIVMSPQRLVADGERLVWIRPIPLSYAPVSVPDCVDGT
jgi:hypothetical protein